MILQRLVELYDRVSLRSTDPVPPFAFGRERIGFELVIDPGGGPAELNDLRVPALNRAGQMSKFLESPWKVVPYRGDRSSNIKPNFLWDNTGYVFGQTAKGRDARKRAAFLSLHQELLARCPGDDGLRAVVDFLSAWTPDNYERFSLGQEAIDENVVFRVRGLRGYVHETHDLQRVWADFFREDLDYRSGQSLVDGNTVAIAGVHFLIQGVDNAQPTGASLSSFNASAYESYGLKSSYNSPTSVEQTFKYAVALKELLLYERRKALVGDSTIVWWAERPVPIEGFFSDLWGDSVPRSLDVSSEDRRRIEQVRLFFSQLREGQAHGEAIADDDGAGFYVLALAPNVARLSVRFWKETTVGELKARLAEHVRDAHLVGARDDEPPLTVERILRSVGRAKTDKNGREDYDRKTVPAPLAGALARAILTGAPYPQMLLVAMVTRLRADGAITHPRVAAIKACITRSRRLLGNLEEVPVGLDTQRTEPAYVTGRLFAMLEKIQRDSAEGGLNSTIKDRYFSSASATPGVVFPRLIRLSQHHLAKLEIGRRIYHDKQLGEVMDKLDGFAPHFGLENQGLFAVGYFHQKQAFYRKKDHEGDDE